jgi:hypothetical protein
MDPISEVPYIANEPNFPIAAKRVNHQTPKHLFALQAQEYNWLRLGSFPPKIGFRNGFERQAIQ